MSDTVESLLKRQKVLANFGDFALQSEDLDEVLTEACRLVGDALGTGRAKVLEIEPGGESLFLRAGVGWDPGVVGHVHIPMGERSSESYAIEAAAPVITQDISQEPRFDVPPFMKEAGVVALANVPVFLPGRRAYGLLQVDDTVPRDFDENDTEFLRTYATILGPVIDRLLKLQELRASEERFRLTVGAATDYAIFVTDAEDCIIDWLPGAVAVFGWSAEEALGQPGAILFTPEDREAGEPEREIETARREGYAPNVRWHQRKDGSRVFIEGSVRALHEIQGGREGFLKIGQDVTQWREADERLRLSEERFQQIAQAVDQVFHIVDPAAGKLLYVSPAYERVWGRSPEPLFEDLRPFLEAIHPEDRARVAAAQARPMEARNEMEYRILRPDGAVRWIRDRVFPALTPDRKPEWRVGIAEDITKRKLAEMALLDRERELQTLTDALPVLVSYVDAERRYRFINKVYETWFPRRREEIIGKPVREVVGEAAYAEVAHHMDAALRGERVTFSQFLPYADTAGRHIEAEYIPRQAPDGSIEGFYTLVQDVTTRKAAEQALRESEERYRTLFNTIEAGFCVIEVILDGTHRPVDYRFVEANPAFERHTGLVDAVGRTARELVSDLEPFWIDTYGRVALTGEPARFENGSEPMGRWFEVRAQRVGEPKAYRVALLFSDITERRRAEERLRELNETLEAQVAERTADRDRMWRLTTDVMLVARFDGTITAINPAWERLLGWCEEQLLGRAFFDFVHPDDLPATLAEAGRLSEGVTTFRFENRYRAKDGSYRWISWIAVPEDGLIHAVGRDITAEKERQAELEAAQEALRQAQKMEAMGQLTGGVAHDFNNLLTPIVASLDILQRRGVGSEREQRLMEGAAQSAERAKTLVQRLLAFARRQPLQPVAVDIADLVRGMADLVSSTTGPQIRVAVEVEDDLPPAKADPNQLEMALLNLAVNARDAMPEGGTLRITAAAEEVKGPVAGRLKLKPSKYIRLSVADTGVGMDKDTLARAVEPFFSTKGVGKGTGLGLSMVHGLTSQLGGALVIHSRPGLGTNVELWLPQSQDRPEAAAPAVGLEQAQGRGTVLLVDDEAFVRLSTAELLEDLGYQVLEAASAEEALGVVRNGTPLDLVVTDHLMPGMTGSDLARTVRTLRPGVPVLIISGYAESEGIEPDLPRLTKPFRKDELVASLAGLAGGPAS